ncbi:meiotic recombination protein [Elaphomyces granulatus]
MPAPIDADTIRILVATDNHVGCHERDPVRGDDSWKSFHEVLCLAREHDVDLVLLAGDLFHENIPSRKALYQVMRSLRMNCLGDRPCELEMLSDASETFPGAFNHVNYEDRDLNVAIPVSGLLNYYGRTPESDRLLVKPVLLQKGHTKLALYGIGNVRDERLFAPSAMAMSASSALLSSRRTEPPRPLCDQLSPRSLSPRLDMVIWGHEHECLVEPQLNLETNFHVIQPGSSIATSLVAGEAAPKHVTLLHITGREFHTEPLRLKTVCPMVVREIILADDKAVNVEELIEEAAAQWQETHPADRDAMPLPLVRLRVDAPTVAASIFYQKRKSAATRRVGGVNDEAGAAISHLTALDTVRVEQLVRDFLAAQSLTILPQNSFGDAVSQFVDKDDKHAMEMFVNESLENQAQHLLALDYDVAMEASKRVWDDADRKGKDYVETDSIA